MAKKTAKKAAASKPEKSKSLESWIWDAACSIRGTKDAPKNKDDILPLIFTKRLCNVFDDTAQRDGALQSSKGKPQSLPAGQANLNRIGAEVGSRKKAFQLAKTDHTARRDSAISEPEGTPQVVSAAKDNRARFYLPPQAAERFLR